MEPVTDTNIKQKTYIISVGLINYFILKQSTLLIVEQAHYFQNHFQQ